MNNKYIGTIISKFVALKVTKVPNNQYLSETIETKEAHQVITLKQNPSSIDFTSKTKHN